MKTTALVLITAMGAIMAADKANATLVDLGPGSFTPAATVITFDEFPLGTVNPSITLAAGSLGNVTVSFAASFQGQTIGGRFPLTLIDSVPTGPLTLDGGNTSVVNDGANPVVSGDPIFNGPISVFFSVPVAAVGLDGGFFDAIGATTIKAYNANGNVLGSIVNSSIGTEFFGLATSNGLAEISGISFFITGDELAGFGIDNLTFGGAEVVVSTPESGSLVPVYIGLGALAFVFRRQIKTQLA